MFDDSHQQAFDQMYYQVLRYKKELILASYFEGLTKQNHTHTNI